MDPKKEELYLVRSKSGSDWSLKKGSMVHSWTTDSYAVFRITGVQEVTVEHIIKDVQPA